MVTDDVSKIEEKAEERHNGKGLDANIVTFIQKQHRFMNSMNNGGGEWMRHCLWEMSITNMAFSQTHFFH